jgi:hypothetical protein
MPEIDAGVVDPNYIRERIRDDLLPLARSCYDQLIERTPDAGNFRVVMAFRIVGDEHIGGIIDDASFLSDAGAGDATFEECMRGSTMSLAFRPPPHSGTLTVHYPLTFTRDTPDGE